LINGFNILVDDKDDPGKESILHRNPQNGFTTPFSHGGHWCAMIQGVSNYSINQHAQEQQKKTHSRPAERIHGEKKVFFASPYFWSYVQDGQHKGANKTQHIDIFTCSKMLIPVNVQKHWVLACIDFDEKRISRCDSVGNDHPTNSGILFKWLHNEHSSSADPYTIGIANWRVDLAPLTATFMPRHNNSYDCGVFVCFYAAYIAIQQPFTFTQADIDNMRM
jgi:Ulp1 family protease